MPYRFSDRMRSMKPSTIREMLKMTERPDVISFAGGLPAPELFPVDDIRVAAERVLVGAGAQAFQYGVTQGIAPLREQIAVEMADRGIACDADDILITTGSQQGLDLVGKIFIDAGDAILTENPTYLAAIQSFQCFQARFQAVPTDDEGIIPDAVGELAEKTRFRFLYVIPNFQNPTGRTLSLARRHQLLEIAHRHDLLIVEDDPYGRLRYRGEHLPPLKSLDDEGRVIYLSTFSKTVAPGFRTAWAVAPKAVLDKLIIAKQAADLHTSSFDQLVLDRYLRDFDNRKHVARVCAAYGERYGVMAEALAAQMPEGFSWTQPEGGMFLWMTGPDGFDTLPLFRRAIEHGVAFVPGGDFFVGDEGRQCLRLNFSNAQPDDIRRGVERLAGLCRDSLGN
ncbi:PLP-dependent aminotransferase family protein [uncultured Propionivibrio sp.]|uniref:aminotransferase-like domain-containing protein n=1 Tax=uncultured Propionivibrio sp. TaxID=426737 RepID=UPI0029C0DA67|nr:PLP-dependent aminotransferase family protein [uncultured Propionivibrio sp.]